MADDAFKRRLESFETAHKAAEAVDTNKLNFYTAGQQKKSKREREKEAAEAKRLQEEEDAARAYKDFVASFDDPASTGDHGGRGLKTFVRAGGSGSPSAPQSFGHPSPASSSGYRPGPSTASRPTSNPLAPRDATHAPPAAGPTHRPAFKQPSQKTGAALFADDDGPAVPAPAAPGKKRRAMDHFLEELKRDQDTREKRLQQQVAQGVATSVSAAAAQDLARSQGPSAGGSFDTGDPRTTNLHVGNLPANVTANALGMHFAQYGPVASVKIMWPREQGGANIGMMQNSAAFAATRAGLNGFIAFMKRDDAQRALDKMDGVEWGGAILQLGWGKAMPLPSRPIYVADTPYQRSGRSRSPSPKRSRRESRSPDYHDSDRRDRGRPSKRSRRSRSDSRSDRSRSRSPDRSRGGRRSRSRSRSRNRSPDHRKGYSDRRAGSRSRSRSPRERRWPKLDSRELQGRLEDVAEKIRQYGKRYEDTLRDKERNNPSYDFLRNNALPAFHYFKMLLDNRYRAPSPPPPPFVDEGDTQVQSSDESDIEREMKDKKRNNLGRLSRAKLEAMLRTITSTRERIGQVMCFALDRPDAADEVSDVLIQSLLISSTPVPRKFARLCVISDILHNCAGTPTNAWKYRSLFESKLPQVFTHLGEIYKSFPGRMKAEIFRKQIMTIVNVWEHWLVFNPSVLADLATRLSTGDTAAQTESEANGDVEARSHSAKAVESSRKPLAGFAAVKSGSTGPEIHHDQDEDLDGQAIDDPATANQDLDGEPLDGDDIDGAPM